MTPPTLELMVDANETIQLGVQFEAIANAMVDRWALDALAITDGSLRGERARLLAEQQAAKAEALTALAESQAAALQRPLIEAHVRLLIDRAENRIGELLARVDLDGGSRLQLLDNMRIDFVWLSILVDMLADGVHRDPTLADRSDIDGIKRRLAAASAATDAAAYQRLETMFDRLRQRTLCVRAERDVSESAERLEPEACWGRRLALSRLQAELQLTNQTTRGSTEVNIAVERLRCHRNRLADAAEEQLRAAPVAEAPDKWREVVAAFEGDANEIASYLQDADLPKATSVLELALEDADRLVETAGRLSTAAADLLAKQRVLAANVATQRCRRTLRGELQDKRLAQRLEAILGRRGAAWLERLILLLVLAMVAAITIEAYWETKYDLSHATRETFAWLELALCSTFLAEFAFKWSLSDNRWLYFRRHWFVDLFASLPFGFVFHHLEHIEYAAYESLPQVLRILRLARLPALARYLQAFRPFLRIVRLFAFAFKASDHLVRRHSKLFNQNIVLFEPDRRDEFESDVQWKYRRLAGMWRRRRDELFERAGDSQKLAAIEWELADVEIRLSRPMPYLGGSPSTSLRSASGVRVEALVRRLTEMTPERLVDAGGQAFADSLHRYIRLFDVPVVRRLPIVRRFVAVRDHGAAETASLAANYVGHLVQRVVDFAYYLADLQGTISAPIFLDRLGATLVKTTAGPAKRLLSLGISLLALYAVVHLLGFRGLFHRFFEKTRDVLAGPITILGILCAIPLLLGLWIRRIADQATEYCERIVEAQFAVQTKSVKAAHTEVDRRFLAERVIAPEIELRGLDDFQPAVVIDPTSSIDQSCDLRLSDEMLFLRSVDMLYRDYLDGALFHRTDTKTTNQLLGNLALTNLRHTSLEFVRREAKQLRALDLSRAGSLLGGPYLWFNYINRIITQQTAQLIVDYNTNVSPAARLACAPDDVRLGYRRWLATRLGVAEESVELPCVARREGAAPPQSVQRVARVQQLQSVDFNAIDFLAENAPREQELLRRYGPTVVELMRRDRANVVRFAFRSFPLHRVPLPRRTFNPLVLYEKYAAGGRIFALPAVLAIAGLGLAWKGFWQTTQAIRNVLDPKLQRHSATADSFHVARRKINRMRKPVFMRTLWLRARFDVEYVGLPMPSMPLDVGRIPAMERDLDFIAASRRDRAAAEQLRRRHRERLRWIGRWLGERRFDFDTLPARLQSDYPYLANRTAEVVRAVVVACLVDFDDLFALASSMEGLLRCCRHALAKGGDAVGLPPDLPPLVERDRPLWHRVQRNRRPNSELFERNGFEKFTEFEQWTILRYLRRHRASLQGWLDIVMAPGLTDPWSTWDCRVCGVILKTDLWSDQLVALRTVQSLALLDLHHYCELVWKLGGYEASEGRSFDAALPSE